MGGPQSQRREPLRKLQCWDGLKSSWVSLGASWEGLRASWEGLRASWEGPEASWEGPKARWEAPGGGRTDGRTETKTEKISLCGDAIGHRPLRGRCPKGGSGEGREGEEGREESGREGGGGGEREREENQSPTGNIWSSVPLPCFS